MPRTKDPMTKYKMKKFLSNGHLYAITTDPKVNERGFRVSNITIWGNLTEDLVFLPHLRFKILPADEKEKFIFPSTWDVSHKDDTEGVPDQGKEMEGGEDKYLIYGDSYMLDKLSSKCGLREDLESVFGKERTDAILTIAYFRILYRRSCSRLASTAKVQWFPSEDMDSAMITRLSQSITKDEADRFMALRKKREESGKADWFGVAGTSISTYSADLSDARWGKRKEHDATRQVGFMVMYNMASRLPAHYRKLPGNIPDSRTLRLLVEDLRSADFGGYGLILDREYLSEENLDVLVPEGIRAIFMAKAKDAKILSRIDDALSEKGDITKTGTFLREHDCYAKDYTYGYYCKESEGKGKGIQRLCLFFDPETKGAEEKKLTVSLMEEEESIEAHVRDGIAVDASLLRKLRSHFAIEVDGKGKILSWSRDEEGIAISKRRCGFFAIVCANMDASKYPLGWVLSTYGMRDMQEKAFMYMKSWQGGRRLRTWSEQSTDGRMFFPFVALILNCYLHERFLSSGDEFRKKFQTPWNVLDEMRSVRLVRLRGRKPKVSEFVGKQIDIFNEFALEIPT